MSTHEDTRIKDLEAQVATFKDELRHAWDHVAHLERQRDEAWTANRAFKRSLALLADTTVAFADVMMFFMDFINTHTKDKLPVQEPPQVARWSRLSDAAQADPTCAIVLDAARERAAHAQSS